ncbi:DNA-binding protein [Salmonella enterica]|nr:DNA-binding protein [Salmonella enterica]ELF4914165.1 DNA-binding protein [Salmonella enterica]
MLSTYEPEQIIEAGLALQAEGRNITGFALRNQVGGGNPTRLRQIWDEYQASQSTVVTEPVAELPVEVAEEVKTVSAALSERITRLATELNDKAVRAAERRVAEVTRAAGEQTAQAERELADAAQTVDDLEEKLDELQDGYDRLTRALESERSQRQQQDVEMARLKERLAAAEENARQREERHQEQARHKNTREDLQKQLEQISAEADTRTEELKSERDKVSTLLTRLESQENALASERQQHQATRKTLQQRLEQAVADAQARALETMREKETVAALRGEAEALQRQNQSLMAALSGNKQSGGQNA